MKAWIVREPVCDYLTVVFAETRGRAILRSDHFDGCDYLDFRAKRAPQYDGYAERGRVPVEVLLKDGWSWTCQSCNTLTSEENGTVVNDNVYCDNCDEAAVAAQKAATT